MKWISHTAIAASSAAIVSPILIPAAVVGATAPDWLEWLLKPMGFPIKHRRQTHYLIVWLALWIALLVLPLDSLIITHLAAFAYGGVTHILTDAVTVQGVPFAPSSRRNFHLFGGRLRTGSTNEYVIAAALSISFALVATQSQKLWSADAGFFPYFFDWRGAYEQGILDAYEWKQNRWKFI